MVNGEPTYPENTIPAFRNSAAEGFVLEMDAKLSADGVPVVIHDATLNRTTDCRGRVDAKTVTQLRRCRVDLLGTEGNAVKVGARSRRAARIPTLADALVLLKRTGADANIEIRNVPTDPDFDPSGAFATAVAEGILESRMPQSRLILQSFYPPNLLVARGILPDAEYSFLTLSAANDGGVNYAQANHIEWVSPQWPVDAAYVAKAHAAGRQIVPYTLDSRGDIVGAADEGVDALISNDPTRARRVLKRTTPAAPPMPGRPTKADCRPTKARLNEPPIKSFDREPGAPRVFAMQYKQEIRNATTYGAFRTKIECMIPAVRRPLHGRQPAERGGVHRGRGADDVGHRVPG